MGEPARRSHGQHKRDPERVRSSQSPHDSSAAALQAYAACRNNVFWESAMPTTVMTNERKPIHCGMLIGGEWTSTARLIDVFNPARPDELVGTVPRGGPGDVEGAIAAAKA